MTNQQPSGVERRPPIGVRLSVDIEAEAGPRGVAYKARARWIDSVTGRRVGLKRSHTTLGEAERWLESLEIAAATGIDPGQTLATLVATIGDRWARAIDRTSTYDPYSAGLRLRVLPKLGHLPIGMITVGLIDRAIDDWELLHGRSTVKNTVSVLVLVLDEAVRDGLLPRNPAKDRARRRTAGRAIEADEPASPRDLALPDVETLNRLVESVDAAGGHDAYGDTVTVLATSGAAHQWGRRVARWRHRPCSRPHPRRSSDLPRARGSRDEADQGPAEKDRSDNRSPATALERLTVGRGSDERLVVGLRGGVYTTATLRDATGWDELVRDLGLPGLVRHGLRHTALTWMADAGIDLHMLQRVAGHKDPAVTAG